VRRVRDLSCGDTRVYLEFEVRCVLCRASGKVGRERLAFLADNPLYTKRLATFVDRRCRVSTIKDVAKELRLDWETVEGTRQAVHAGAAGARRQARTQGDRHRRDRDPQGPHLTASWPGTSKWNRIEHRLFCHITQNWRSKPLTSRLAVVELIAATTTTTGLTVACELDTNTYEKGIKVTKAEMATLNLHRDTFHPEWNYTIEPRPQT